MNYRINNRRGFTLLEVLIVTALTGVLLGLVFGPLIQSAQFTRSAQILSRAQDGARVAISQISRDLAEALYVYDTGGSISCPMVKIDPTTKKVLETLPAVTPQVRYAKLDLVLPMMQGYCTSLSHPAGKPRTFSRNYTYLDPSDPTNTKTDQTLVENSPVCPYDQSPLELRPVQPLAPDTKIARYFIGLRDNTSLDTDNNQHYVNPYSPFNMTSITTAADKSMTKNMYVLYRAEFSPTDLRLFPSGRTALQNIDDAEFFYNTAKNNANPGNPDERYCDAWSKISRVIATPDDMDLVNVTFDTTTGDPLITPTVQFTPTVVTDDTLVPTVGANGNAENSDFIPTVYKASYGNWVAPYKITLYRKGASRIYYTRTYQNEVWIFADPGTPDDNTDDTAVFDITRYQNTSQGPDATDPTWIGYQYGFGKMVTDPANLNTIGRPELALTMDLQRGSVNFAFPHVDLKASDRLSNTTEGGGANSTIMGGKSPVSFWVNTVQLNGYYLTGSDPFMATPPAGGFWEKKRFVEFNLPGVLGGSFSSPTVRVETDLANYQSRQSPYQFLQNSTVATGMEKVIGPNANSGQSYGMPMLYTRLPFMDMFGEPGVNQYKIDLAHPVTAWDSSASLAGVVGWTGSAWTSTSPDNLNRTGTAAIYFRTEQNEAGPSYRLPQLDDLIDVNNVGPNRPDLYPYVAGNGTISDVFVLYYEQNNRQTDVVKASYVTKSVMTVTLGLRIYDNSTGRPYTLQLSGKTKIRNSSL